MFLGVNRNEGLVSVFFWLVSDVLCFARYTDEAVVPPQQSHIYSVERNGRGFARTHEAVVPSQESHV